MRRKAKGIFLIVASVLMIVFFVADTNWAFAKTIAAEQDSEDGDEETGNFLSDLKKALEELNAKDAETKLVTGGMELTMQCGFDNMVKYGRDICIHSEITNHEENFVGYMRVIIPSENDDNVMYQKEISIPAGETKKIMFPLSPDVAGSKYNVQIVNEQGEVVVEKELIPSFQYDSEKLFVGVLSDEKDYLGYLSQTDVKVFYLDADKLPDEEEALDTLDIIVINNFNTGNLSEEQYEALKTWVSNGGNLVIGTGAGGSKTLDVFKDDFITGAFGNVEADGSMLLDLDNSTEINLEQSKKIFYVIDKGFGRVLVCKEDLGVEYDDWAVIGSDLLKGIKNNLSEYKKGQLQESSDGSYYDILGGLTSVGNLKVPSVKKYVFVLVIYILLVGPFLYFVLKKLDRRHFTWGLVPVMSIIFAISVYALGNETRLDDPFVGYMNFYNLDGSGKDQGEENIFFNITVPTNNKYTFELPETTEISYLNSGYDAYRNGGVTGYKNKKDKLTYKTAISYGAAGTTLQMKNYSAFSSAYFKIGSSHAGEGNYDYNIKSYGYHLSGTFTNNLGYDLEHAMVVCDEMLVYVGDIKNGETIDLSNVEKKNIYNIASADCIYEGDLLSELAGGNAYDNDVEPSVAKRYYALQYMCNYNFTELSKGAKLIAFTEEEAGDGFVQQLDLKCSGLKVVKIPLQVDRTSGKKEFIANLDQYASMIEGEFDEVYRYSYSEVALQEVQFEEGDKIKSIGYNKAVNPELKSSYSNYYGFDGKVYFYNLDTGVYEQVMESGV